MQKYGRLVIKNSVWDSLVCNGDSLILDVASPRTHKPKIVNESLDNKTPNIMQRVYMYLKCFFLNIALRCESGTAMYLSISVIMSA